jgi:hypothetical protein
MNYFSDITSHAFGKRQKLAHTEGGLFGGHFKDLSEGVNYINEEKNIKIRSPSKIRNMPVLKLD